MKKYLFLVAMLCGLVSLTANAISVSFTDGAGWKACAAQPQQKLPAGVVLPPAYANQPYSKEGWPIDVNPALTIGDISPNTTQSLAVVMRDPAAGTHWLIWDIPYNPAEGASVNILANIPQTDSPWKDGFLPSKPPIPSLGVPSQNTGAWQDAVSANGNIGYTGPYPPSGEVHEYDIFAYALNGILGEVNPPSGTVECPYAPSHPFAPYTKIYCYISSVDQFEAMIKAKGVPYVRSEKRVAYYPGCPTPPAPAT